MGIRSRHGARWAVTALVFAALIAACKDAPEVEYGREVKGDEVSTGPLVNGKKNGAWTTVRDGKIVDITSWRDGRKHGVSRNWDFLYSDWYYVDGKPHGRVRFFKGKQLIDLGWFRKYKRHGMRCEWESDGTLSHIWIYDMDRITEWAKDPPGQCPLVLDEPRHLDPDDHDYR